jgi:hypothetical protein
MDEVCNQRGILPRSLSDKVAVFVPMRNIETWLAYLDGEDVNETDTYPHLEREWECQRHVNVLDQMCIEEKLRTPVPASQVRQMDIHQSELLKWLRQLVDHLLNTRGMTIAALMRCKFLLAQENREQNRGHSPRGTK